MAPPVVEGGREPDDCQHGQRQAGQQQQPEAQVRVPHRRPRPPDGVSTHADAAQHAARQRHQRCGDGQPCRNVVPGQVRCLDRSPLKQLRGRGRVPCQGLQRRAERERVRPQVGRQHVQRARPDHRKHRPRRQHVSPLPPPRLPQVQPPQRQYRRIQHHPHDPQVRQYAHAHPAQHERPDRIFAERPVRHVQRDHEHAQKRQILAVEERMRVQPRLQHEQEQGEQRHGPAAGQPIDEQRTTPATDQKEGVRHQMPQEIDALRVLQPHPALQQEQGEFEGDSIVLVVLFGEPVQPVGGARDEGEVPGGYALLSCRIGHDPIVAPYGGPYQEERHTDQQRLNRPGKAIHRQEQSHRGRDLHLKSHRPVWEAHTCQLLRSRSERDCLIAGGRRRKREAKGD